MEMNPRKVPVHWINKNRNCSRRCRRETLGSVPGKPRRRPLDLPTARMQGHGGVRGRCLGATQGSGNELSQVLGLLAVWETKFVSQGVTPRRNELDRGETHGKPGP